MRRAVFTRVVMGAFGVATLANALAATTAVGWWWIPVGALSAMIGCALFLLAIFGTVDG